jgi:hypothetical protein
MGTFYDRVNNPWCRKTFYKLNLICLQIKEEEKIFQDDDAKDVKSNGLNAGKKRILKLK